MKFGRLLNLILVTGLLVEAAAYGQEIHLEEEGLYSTENLTARSKIANQHQVTIKAATSLRGELNIVVGDSAFVTLEYTKKALTAHRARAIDYIDLISINLARTPEGVRLELRAPNPPPWDPDESGMVMAKLVLPAECSVEIDAAYFDVKAVGPLLAMVNTSSLGRLQVSEVTERLKLNTANRRVMIENISGEISVTTSNANLTARNLFCTETDAVLRNEDGDITIDGVMGGVNVSTQYGRIKIEDFRPRGRRSFVRGHSGPISVSITEFTDCRLLINNRYEDIDLTVPAHCNSTLALAVDEQGKIEVSDLIVKPETVLPNRLNLVVGDGSGLIRATIQGDGTIHVRGQDEGD